jgi:DNA polymerase-3 subunit epsilon
VIRFYVNQPFDNPWLDLAQLAPALFPAVPLKSLDEWLARFGIPVGERHSAAADAFATALLAARLLPEARRQGADSFGRMVRLARNARWVR